MGQLPTSPDHPLTLRCFAPGDDGGGGGERCIGKGEVPPPPPGRPANAQPLSPRQQAPASMAFVTDSNHPQPPPTACLTASGAAPQALSLLMHPLEGGGIAIKAKSSEGSENAFCVPQRRRRGRGPGFIGARQQLPHESHGRQAFSSTTHEVQSTSAQAPQEKRSLSVCVWGGGGGGCTPSPEGCGRRSAAALRRGSKSSFARVCAVGPVGAPP